MENNKKNIDISEEITKRPSPETFAKWRAMGEELYQKRKRRNKALVGCAVFLLICIGSFVTVRFINPPVVEAGPEGKVQIDNTMERTVEYTSWADLPQDIKDTFIEVKNLPAGLEVERIEVYEMDYANKIKLYLKSEESKFVIRQHCCIDGRLPSLSLIRENESIEISGIEVYVERNNETEVVTYKYVSQNMIIDMVVPQNVNEDIIEEIIKTVQ